MPEKPVPEKPATEKNHAFERQMHTQHRVVIERVRPELNSGAFAIKRVVGDTVVVEADASSPTSAAEPHRLPHPLLARLREERLSRAAIRSHEAVAR